MARTIHPRTKRRQSPSKAAANGATQEHRIETLRPDLFILKIGERSDKLPVPRNEQASVVIGKLAKALAKPGIPRDEIFGDGSRKVYAYSVYPQDPSKLIREDVSGHKVLGRFVGGRFRPLRNNRAL